MLETAVAFFVFNRPDTTRQVWERIRAVRPRTLLVIADAARSAQPGERERCAEVRHLVESGIDWPCDFRHNYAVENLGCGRRLASGLDWVFSNVEEAIVLEDDCLPEPTFFPFCSELLARYRNEPRIGVVGGSNHQYRAFPCEDSYYFSIYNHVWGWASWRRAWRQFDYAMKAWPDFRAGRRLDEWLGGRAEAVRYWRGVFDATARGEFDTWDYRWTFACWRAGMLSALPRRPLVRNIGFGAAATHTQDAPAVMRAANSEPMIFPLKHPAVIAPNSEADAHTEEVLFRRENTARRWARRIRTVLKRRPV